METPAAPAVARTVRLDLDADAAWRLVGTAAGLARWLGGAVEVDPTVGAALRVVDDDGAVRTGVVLEVEDGERLAFAWAGADGEASTVTLEVVADDEGGSRVTVTEQRAGGPVAACLDAGAAWGHRMLHLEVAALSAVPAFAGAAGLHLDVLV